MSTIPPADRIVSGVPPTHPAWWGHHRRPATDRERLEYAAVSWIGDVTSERARLVSERHPDLAPMLPSDVRSGLPIYERNRAAAVQLGKSVAEPTEERIAEIDEAAAEFRATRTMPEELEDVERRGRAAFQAAIRRPDFDSALTAWASWLADVEARNTFVGRQLRPGMVLFGKGYSDRLAPVPHFLHEFERAVDGTSSFESIGR